MCIPIYTHILNIYTFLFSMILPYFQGSPDVEQSDQRKRPLLAHTSLHPFFCLCWHTHPYTISSAFVGTHILTPFLLPLLANTSLHHFIINVSSWKGSSFFPLTLWFLFDKLVMKTGPRQGPLPLPLRESIEKHSNPSYFLVILNMYIHYSFFMPACHKCMTLKKGTMKERLLKLRQYAKGCMPMEIHLTLAGTTSSIYVVIKTIGF